MSVFEVETVNCILNCWYDFDGSDNHKIIY